MKVHVSSNQALTSILEQTRLQCAFILFVEKNYPKMLNFPVVLSVEPAKELEEVVFWIKFQFAHF